MGFPGFSPACWVRLGFQVSRNFWNTGGMGNIVVRNKTWVIKTHMEKSVVSFGVNYTRKER